MISLVVKQVLDLAKVCQALRTNFVNQCWLYGTL